MYNILIDIFIKNDIGLLKMGLIELSILLKSEGIYTQFLFHTVEEIRSQFLQGGFLFDFL